MAMDVTTPASPGSGPRDAVPPTRLGQGKGPDPRPGPVGLAVGMLLAPLFGLASAVRGKRCVHPGGVAYTAVLAVPDPPSRLAYGSVLGEPGEHPGVVRLSRGMGYRPPRRDVHGLAVRVVDAGGPSRHQDVLFVSAVEQASGRHRIVETVGYGPLLSTVLGVRAGTAVVRLVATPIGEPPVDTEVFAGRAEGMSFTLSGQIRGGPVVALAELRLEHVLDASEAEDLRFDVWNAGGGIVPVGVLGSARRVVYPASQLGRRLRGG